jgi:hypothetical protein
MYVGVRKGQVESAVRIVEVQGVKDYVTTVRSEGRCAFRLRYVDLVVSIEVAVEVCCCFTVFSC